jgi:hypothetical protein
MSIAVCDSSAVCCVRCAVRGTLIHAVCAVYAAVRGNVRLSGCARGSVQLSSGAGAAVWQCAYYFSNKFKPYFYKFV